MGKIQVKIQKVLFCFSFFYLAIFGCSRLNPLTEVKVSDFGAVPNDGKDDTPAIIAALKNCEGRKNATLTFEIGSYDIYSNQKNERGIFNPAIEVNGFVDFTIDGQGAELIGHDLATMFSFSKCKNLLITNLTTDWNPLPYTQGKVVNVDTGFVDMEVAAPFSAQAGRPTEAILGYDMQNRRMARRFTDHYQLGYKRNSEVIRPGIMRLFVGREDRFAGKLPSVGDYIIARHQVYNYQSFQFLECSEVHVENVNIYCNPGMGLIARDTRDIFISHLKVMIRPGSGRWMSCTADATNFESCRGTVIMENCLFEGQGDDATNVRSGEYLLVDERLSDTKLKIKHGYKYTSGIPDSPAIGDILELSSGNLPLLPYATAEVSSVEVLENENALIVGFSSKLPENTQKGDITGNTSSCPVLRIRNCTAIRNRARGFVIKTRDVVIEDCTLQDICASGVALEADVNAWWEAIGSRNVIIKNNRFIRCKFEPEYLNGVIESHTMSQTTPAGVHRNITIDNNIFLGSDGNILKLGSADSVKIINNILDGPKDEAILLYNSKHILISGNKLTNSLTGLKIGNGCDTATIRLENNIGF
jgi:hypothetical protein